ncbi:MAG: hypothetical protein WC391_07995 [Methanoregula sp.]|jgi:hypothetical protein
MSIFRTLEFNDDEYSVRIKVRNARISDGIQRSLMIFQARLDNPVEADSKDAAKIAERVLTAFTFPACASATVSIENTNPDSPVKISFPLALAEFREMPELLVTQWEELILDLNPQWRPGGAPSEEGEVGKSS